MHRRANVTPCPSHKERGQLGQLKGSLSIGRSGSRLWLRKQFGSTLPSGERGWGSVRCLRTGIYAKGLGTSLSNVDVDPLSKNPQLCGGFRKVQQLKRQKPRT
ncbi:hypothetical protein CEN41_03325 [Fischerella thermalis CCMEE 5330]|uniref:Uncharacterized protein n=1 Tax=Fischerella thermalis CCMEE 5330 TaxID=2019670 RepID=A0A2N6MLC4_9CYAN|nr:hypothetical protein CEN41_03325 [Fischerella thermalis CCMEE 5330]